MNRILPKYNEPGWEWKSATKVPGAVLSPQASRELQARLLECSIAEAVGSASIIGATNLDQIGTAQRLALRVERVDESQ